MKLEGLFDKFVNAGYESLNFLTEHMASDYPITDQVLWTEIGIVKPGHRVRILGKLMEATQGNKGPPQIRPGCNECLLL